MTRKKTDNNRKKANKVTVYLSDELLAYLTGEAEGAGSKSVVVQQGLLARRAARTIKE